MPLVTEQEVEDYAALLLRELGWTFCECCDGWGIDAGLEVCEACGGHGLIAVEPEEARL